MGREKEKHKIIFECSTQKHNSTSDDIRYSFFYFIFATLSVTVVIIRWIFTHNQSQCFFCTWRPFVRSRESKTNREKKTSTECMKRQIAYFPAKMHHIR